MELQRRARPAEAEQPRAEAAEQEFPQDPQQTAHAPDVDEEAAHGASIGSEAEQEAFEGQAAPLSLAELNRQAAARPEQAAPQGEAQPGRRLKRRTRPQGEQPEGPAPAYGSEAGKAEGLPADLLDEAAGEGQHQTIQYITITGGNVSHIIGTQISRAHDGLAQLDPAVIAEEVVVQVLAKLEAAQQQAEAGRLDDGAVGKALSDARVLLGKAVRHAREQHLQLIDAVTAQLALPEGERDAEAIASGIETAKGLLVGMGVLAAIIADLATTGGLITLATLSFSAGHALAIAPRAGGACNCGKLA